MDFFKAKCKILIDNKNYHGKESVLMKIVELREKLSDTKIEEDIQKLEIIIKNIDINLSFLEELNVDDYNFISIILEKSKIALIKADEILKINSKYKR